MSIRLRILLPFLALITLAMLFVGELARVNASRLLRSLAQDRLAQAADARQRHLSAVLTRIESTAIGLALDHTGPDTLKSRAQLASALVGKDALEQVALVMEGGEIVVSWTAPGAIPTPLVSEPGVHILPPTPGASVGRLCLSVSAPGGHRLVTVQSLRPLADAIGAVSQLHETVKLTDEEGRHILGARSSDAADGDWVATRELSVGGERWTLSVHGDESVLLAPVRDLRGLLTLITVFALGIVILVAVAVARSLSDPIRLLAEGAERLGGGDLDHRVATDAEDEIGALSRAMDSMARTLAAEIEAHRELNATLELRIAERTELLERSNVELKRFAYVASHDLQTPLRTISGFVQLLERRYADQLDDKGRDYIRRSVEGAKRMQQLIGDLLAYSRIESGGSRFEPVDLDVLCDEVVEAHQAEIEQTKARVTRGSLPTVMGDRGQLAQLFQNLVGNALKYRGEARPDIRIDAEPLAEGGWTISVSDNGIGVPEEHREKIFEIFRRLHTQTEYAGTGIGLAVCRQVVMRHGGRLWVEPSDGGGSVFRFTLPESNEVSA